MAVISDDLLAFVGGNSAKAEDVAFAEECIDVADALVIQYIGDDVGVPVSVSDRAVLAVAQELWNQKSAPNGIAQYSDELGNLTAMRVARDPMRAAYPLLQPFISGGFS